MRLKWSFRPLKQQLSQIKFFQSFIEFASVILFIVYLRNQLENVKYNLLFGWTGVFLNLWLTQLDKWKKSTIKYSIVSNQHCQAFPFQN